MFCPQCGQQQLPGVVRFCSRCGFPLDGVMQLLASGGMMPMYREPEGPKVESPRRKGVKQGGMLFLYGPFSRGGRHTSESNEAFDASLRRGNPEWGVRDVEAVTKLADAAGLSLVDLAEMPANNLTLVFSRS